MKLTAPEQTKWADRSINPQPPVRLTILDLSDCSYDLPAWCPSGVKAFNGYRQRQMQGFRT